MRKRSLSAVLAFGLAALGVMIAPAQASTDAPAAQKASSTSNSVHYREACPAVRGAKAPRCFALERTDIRSLPRRKGVAANSTVTPGTSTAGSYGPADLQSAYNLTSASRTGGTGQTVALVELYDDPTLESDLATYRSYYGLPACTTANGCFRKVNSQGQQSNYPAAPSNGDTGEAALDVDMVSAICPNCHIVVVEDTDMFGAQEVGINQGAKYISTSYGLIYDDPFTDMNTDSHFNHHGIVQTVSSGDSGYGTITYPAVSPYPVVVGGTKLTRDSSVPRGWTESAWGAVEGSQSQWWAGTSGCAGWEGKASWQHDTLCGNKRTSVDVSAVADVNPGMWIYDSGTTDGGWNAAGGTSASSPIVASMYALTGATHYMGAAASLYAHAATGFNDVTSGSNAQNGCSGSAICTAGPGFDGPTGVGTPNGLSGLTAGGQVTGYQGQCMDIQGSNNSNGTPVQVWSCNGSDAQFWMYFPDNRTVMGMNMCLDVAGGGTADGTKVDLYACNGSGAQTWVKRADGSLLNPQSGRCLDDYAFGGSGTQLVLWDCNGLANQNWQSPA